MSGRWFGLVASCALVLGVSVVAAGRPDLRAERSIFLTALDKDNAPIRGLQPADFVVREDGEKREIIRVTAPEDPLFVSLLIAAAIHLLPLQGVLGSDRLVSLYGALPFDEPNLAILMRHRAVLFGLLGLFLVFAAFRPALQTLAFIAGFVSVISYLWLALSVGSYNAYLARVVIADVVALICLAAGAAAHAYQQFQD